MSANYKTILQLLEETRQANEALRGHGKTAVKEAKGDMRPIQDLILKIVLSAKPADLDKLDQLVSDYAEVEDMQKAPQLVRALFALLQKRGK